MKSLSRKIAPLTITLALFLAATVVAVTNGGPDGEAHPHVGLLVFDTDGSPTHRCSGTFLSSTVVLTAGHCTFGTSGGRIWLESDVESGIPGNGYPAGGGTSIEAVDIETHPMYNPNAFFLHDVGIVVLGQVVDLPTYGVLPEIGLLDEMSRRRGLQDQLFTAVGYGIQSIVPGFQADRVRYQGTVQLIDVQGTAGIPAGGSVLFSNNPGQRATGGTCFGDSGGPIFLGDGNVVASVVSFGLNRNCTGTGGGYRIDTIDDQDFINSFLN